jgi:2-oxoisovalerate dehydrogenase E2 component (dihydrolipoyl transacylase)
MPEDTAFQDTSSAIAREAGSQANMNKLRNMQDKNHDTKAKNSGLIVPAVRVMLKQHNIDIKDVTGSGNGGRVRKEDVQMYLDSRNAAPNPVSSKPAAQVDASVEDKVVPLTPIENHMFKVMTGALSIPHFGYSHSVDLTSLTSLRRDFNKELDVSNGMHRYGVSKLTALPFILKALSRAFLQHPRLNAHLETETAPQNPQLIVKASHNFGVAMDTPGGLLVPVVKDVQNRSILSIAAELKRLSTLAKEGRLTPSDISGATFTVSNIGSIGGYVVNPVILPPTVGIVALGKSEEVPVFTKDNKKGDTSITKRERAVISWSADHRVLDGASVARCAQMVSSVLENIEPISIGLR